MKLYLNYVCGNYYSLSQRLLMQQERFDQIMDDPIPYIGQTHLADIDLVLKYCYRAQKANREIKETEKELQDLQTLILKMLDYIGVPLNTKLTGEIPEQVEFTIWADDERQLHYEKTRDLNPVDDADIITIRICNDRHGARMDDEDDD